MGSGTVMLACEQLGRTAYGMELDPKFCQVIVDRMISHNAALRLVKNGANWNYKPKEQPMIVKIADAPIYIEANHVDMIRYDEERQTLAMFKMNPDKKKAKVIPFIVVLAKTETSPAWWKKNGTRLISDINKGKTPGKKCVLPITE
jgi:hypothetical protein